MLYRTQFAVAERGQSESAVNFLDWMRDLLKRGYPDSDIKALEPLLVNQFTRGLKLPKASEALILETPTDSSAAFKTAQKYENLKLVEEKDSLFASNVSSQVGNVRVRDQALVAPRPPSPLVPSQSGAGTWQQESRQVNLGNPV